MTSWMLALAAFIVPVEPPVPDPIGDCRSNTLLLPARAGEQSSALKNSVETAAGRREPAMACSWLRGLSAAAEIQPASFLSNICKNWLPRRSTAFENTLDHSSAQLIGRPCVMAPDIMQVSCSHPRGWRGAQMLGPAVSTSLSTISLRRGAVMTKFVFASSAASGLSSAWELDVTNPTHDCSFEPTPLRGAD